MTIIPKCFYRVSVKGLILDDEKRFLLVKEENGQWEFPGGGLDFGEDPLECLKREVKEEMGLKVISIKDRPSYFVTSLNKKDIWIANVFYEIKVLDLNFIPSKECTELKFVTKEEAFNLDILPNVKEFLKVYRPN
jgi:8-oxo-dGTP pyrophosphatase MutT (NUDIX family)